MRTKVLSPFQITKFSMLKYRHSEALFKMIKVPHGKVPVKVIDDQTFLYLQNFAKEKFKKINLENEVFL